MVEMGWGRGGVEVGVGVGAGVGMGVSRSFFLSFFLSLLRSVVMRRARALLCGVRRLQGARRWYSLPPTHYKIQTLGALGCRRSSCDLSPRLPIVRSFVRSTTDD